MKGYILQQQLIYSVFIEYLLCDKHDACTEGRKELLIMLGLYLEEFHMKIWWLETRLGRAFAVLPEDPGSSPSTYMMARNLL